MSAPFIAPFTIPAVALLSSFISFYLFHILPLTELALRRVHFGVGAGTRRGSLTPSHVSPCALLKRATRWQQWAQCRRQRRRRTGFIGIVTAGAPVTMRSWDARAVRDALVDPPLSLSLSPSRIFLLFLFVYIL